MRQLIKYPGSKWSLTDWITGFFPKHHSYLEPLRCGIGTKSGTGVGTRKGSSWKKRFG